MKEVVICSAVRTPIGNFLGGLSSFGATELGGFVIEETIKRAGIRKEDVDEVIMGNVLPFGKKWINSSSNFKIQMPNQCQNLK